MKLPMKFLSYLVTIWFRCDFNQSSHQQNELQMFVHNNHDWFKVTKKNILFVIAFRLNPGTLFEKCNLVIHVLSDQCPKPNCYLNPAGSRHLSPQTGSLGELYPVWQVRSFKYIWFESLPLSLFQMHIPIPNYYAIEHHVCKSLTAVLAIKLDETFNYYTIYIDMYYYVINLQPSMNLHSIYIVTLTLKKLIVQ